MGLFYCRRCPLYFFGDILCMNCASGYALKFDGVWAIGRRGELVKVFGMEIREPEDSAAWVPKPVGRQRRWVVSNDRESTGVFLTVVGNGQFIDIDGERIEGLRIPTEGLPCPHCGETQLRFYFDNPDRCPQCGKQSLGKGVVYV